MRKKIKCAFFIKKKCGLGTGKKECKIKKGKWCIRYIPLEKV